MANTCGRVCAERGGRRLTVLLAHQRKRAEAWQCPRFRSAGVSAELGQGAHRSAPTGSRILFRRMGDQLKGSRASVAARGDAGVDPGAFIAPVTHRLRALERAAGVEPASDSLEGCRLAARPGPRSIPPRQLRPLRPEHRLKVGLQDGSPLLHPALSPERAVNEKVARPAGPLPRPLGAVSGSRHALLLGRSQSHVGLLSGEARAGRASGVDAGATSVRSVGRALQRGRLCLQNVSGRPLGV